MYGKKGSALSGIVLMILSVGSIGTQVAQTDTVDLLLDEMMNPSITGAAHTESHSLKQYRQKLNQQKNDLKKSINEQKQRINEQKRAYNQGQTFAKRQINSRYKDNKNLRNQKTRELNERGKEQNKVFNQRINALNRQQKVGIDALNQLLKESKQQGFVIPTAEPVLVDEPVTEQEETIPVEEEVEEPIVPVPSNQLRCEETDGGLNFAEKGTLTTVHPVRGPQTFEDKCYMGYIAEFFCSGTAMRMDVKLCSDCSEGACPSLSS